VTNRGLNDMRCFRAGFTLGVHKIPFLEFSPLPDGPTCVEAPGGLPAAQGKTERVVHHWEGHRDVNLTTCPLFSIPPKGKLLSAMHKTLAPQRVS
jgi:hypothetical protein